MKDIENLVNQVRVAFEQSNPSDFPGTTLSVATFPGGCCDDSSRLLAAYLADNGIEGARLIHGSMGGSRSELRSHDWLLINNLIVDITADQFNSKEYENERVICTENSQFHSSFQTKDMGEADFRKQYPVETQRECHEEFAACYEVLLKKLKA
ncbi:TPA: hypothetical protein I7272_24405 [Vibrio parahaemolyticus]|uniref:hypothetical protein n=1 Tax=Vibrio parahaemolyticus TaxID=670 RepID=UPI00111C9990|nr:hypothetical protein [Vibrio parahaemolyticus]HDY8109131.1 hypothetical protein [Vibrio vulnificus]EHR6782880.1 hypothetical protein [Vibrio parahaemolyticus]ELA8132742.1 hypothetical protein [Vibrio parahaemolyticus]TOH25013.1 hypothetical protein CGI83_22900 [Vibrio parahaemolyticus]TOK52050.1 hypothetical protein CGI17_21585 [Vibrio parahaemolyticus]